MKLLSNVFTLAAWELTWKTLTGDTSSPSGRWKNLIKSYPLFVRRFHLPDSILPKPQTCITLGGMYFLLILQKHGKYNQALVEFLNKFQGVDELQEFIIYDNQGDLVIFKDIEILQGEAKHLTHTKPFNDVLQKLIEEYRIVPKMSSDGLIFDVTGEELGDLCNLETSLKRYLYTTT